MIARALIDLRPMRRLVLISSFAFSLGACGGLIPGGQPPSSYGEKQANSQANTQNSVQIGTGTDYPRAIRGRAQPNANAAQPSSRAPVRVSSAPISRAVHPRDRSCIADLGATGARFTPIADTYTAPGCNQLGTVRLSALTGDRSQFSISNLGPVKCETAKAFSGWARYGVDRAARQILGSPLARIETMGSYACRNIAGSTLRSAHATGNAIDVSAFVLKDGRRIALMSDWDDGTAAEREFLRVVQKSACKRFGTVLGPEYNAAHRDHFHLEGTGPKFCK